MHQIWRGREEREKKKRNQRAKKREKRNKGRVSERQRAGIFFFSFLSFFFSTSALSFSFRFNETIKNWSLFAFSLHDNIVYYRFSRRPLYHGRPNALFFDQENCHVLCPSRKEESNFLAFLTPSFQSLDKPAQPSHKRPFSQPSPSFFSVFVFFLRKKLRCFILLCHRISKQDDISTMIIIQLFSCGSLEGRERRIEVQFEIEISMKMEKKIRWRFKICNLKNYFFFYNIIENNLNVWIEWNTVWWDIYKQ